MNSITQFGENAIERMENALEALRQGKGILLVDDENRENEGDIIYPAATMTPKDMALMIRECSGIVCLCISEERRKQLDLRMMVDENNSANQTAFTVSIEAKVGVTTGVSAADRVQTIREAIKEGATRADLASPGHVFPLVAQADGVFARRGHTEGSIDMVKLAGLGDTAVLCEVTNEDGTMARLPELIEFGKKHDMPVVTIDDICDYRKSVNK